MTDPMHDRFKIRGHLISREEFFRSPETVLGANRAKVDAKTVDEFLDINRDGLFSFNDLWRTEVTTWQNLKQVLRRHGYKMEDRISLAEIQDGIWQEDSSFYKDPDFMRAAVQKMPFNRNSLRFTDITLAENGQLVGTFLAKYPVLNASIENCLAQNPEFNGRVLKQRIDFWKDPELANWAWQLLRHDKTFMKEAVNIAPALVKFAPPELQRKLFFMLAAHPHDDDIGYYIDQTLQHDRAFALAMVRKDGAFLRHFEDFRDDEEVVTSAVNAPIGRDGAYSWASERLRAKSEFFLAALDGGEGPYDIFHRLPPALFDDPVTFEKILKKMFGDSEYANPAFWKYPRLALKALRETSSSDDLQTFVRGIVANKSADHEYTKALVAIDGTAVKVIDHDQNRNPEIQSIAVAQNGWAYLDFIERDATSELFAKALAQIYGDAPQSDLKNWDDPAIAVEAIQQDNRALDLLANIQYAKTGEEAVDLEFAKQMLAIDGEALSALQYHFPKEKQSLAVIAVAQNPWALQQVDEDIQTLEMVAQAVQKNGLVYPLVADKLRNKKLEQLALVQIYGPGSPYADLEAWKDPVKVDQALKINRQAYWFAYESMGDREFAKQLAALNGDLFYRLGYPLRTDPELALLAAQDNRAVFSHINLREQEASYLKATARIDTQALLQQFNGHPREAEIWGLAVSALHEAGANFPLDMEKDEASFYAGLAEHYGIHHPKRFRSFLDLHTVIQNRQMDPEDDREVAMLIYPVSDWNGALEQGEAIEDFVRNSPFRVIYFEVGNHGDVREEMAQILDRYTARGNYPLHTGVLAAHASSKIMQFGDGNDGSIRIYDFHQKALSRFGHYFRHQLVVHGCSVGEGREKGTNLINTMADTLTPQVRVSGSTIIGGGASFNFNGLETEPIWEYSKAVYTAMGRRQESPVRTASELLEVSATVLVK
ncbi:MAG: DUF4116 domain-containing protein [Deltaproteobacteria bacterium]|nr:DUF4116 domain-containing protein [Deltaproteobacteria bacterium]